MLKLLECEAWHGLADGQQRGVLDPPEISPVIIIRKIQVWMEINQIWNHKPNIPTVSVNLAMKLPSQVFMISAHSWPFPDPSSVKHLLVNPKVEWLVFMMDISSPCIMTMPNVSRLLQPFDTRYEPIHLANAVRDCGNFEHLPTSGASVFIILRGVGKWPKNHWMLQGTHWIKVRHVMILEVSRATHQIYMKTEKHLNHCFTKTCPLSNRPYFWIPQTWDLQWFTVQLAKQWNSRAVSPPFWVRQGPSRSTKSLWICNAPGPLDPQWMKGDIPHPSHSGVSGWWSTLSTCWKQHEPFRLAA